VAKNTRAYKSSKRSKELVRQKKQEEKRLRRLAKNALPLNEGEEPSVDGETPEDQAPNEQAPDEQTPDDQTPENA